MEDIPLQTPATPAETPLNAVGDPPMLSLEEESCFKHQLLKLAIQKEVLYFFERPSNIHNTLFLKFMRQRIIDFPLWGKRDNAKQMCESLIMSLPEICISSQKATKRDASNKSIRNMVVKCFDLAIRTPQEREYDKETAADEWEYEEDEEEVEVDEEERQRRIKLARTLKQVSEIFQRMLVDVEKNGGYDHLFTMVKTTPHINNLAPMYQRLGKCIAQAMALWVEKEFQDEKQVAKMKRVYTLTPVRAIRAVLGIANPVKLMQGLIHIFIARPFGTRSLIQKFAEILVELKKTDKLLNEAKKVALQELKSVDSTARKNMLKKIPLYIQAHYSVYHGDDNAADDDFDDEEEDLSKLPPNQLIAKVLLDGTIKPKIEPGDVVTLTGDQIDKLYNVIILQMRHKEKEGFVDLLGDEKIVKIVKELLPVIHEPIAKLFNKASVGMHFEVLFKTLKRVIKVAERKEPNQLTRTTMYERVFEKFSRDMYSFLHHIAANDDGTLQDTLKWVVDMLAFMDADTIDVSTLLWPGDVSKKKIRDDVIAEIDDVVRYRIALLGLEEEEAAREEEEGREEAEEITQTSPQRSDTSSQLVDRQLPPRPERPNLKLIPGLVSDFMELAASRLRVNSAPLASVPTM